MLFRWLLGERIEQIPTSSDELRALVAQSMPGADAQAAAVVGAVAGLCAVVAYADRVYTPAEQLAVHELLSRTHGLPAQAVPAVCALLEKHMPELAHESIQTFTRVMYECTDRQARLEVLDVLIDLAAADEDLSTEETNLLRRICSGFGLSDQDYLASQARHRERLSVLQAP